MASAPSIGPAIVDIAYDTDKAHAPAECSGNGECDYKTGNCKCYPGFTGYNCGKQKCFNDCSGHGRCVSMRQAAEEFDGYHLNHTTIYDRWDADIIHGCVCDYGYSGADCSQRSCEYGVDPRLSDQAREKVTLKWLYPYSTVEDLLYMLQKAPGIPDGASGFDFDVVSANRSESAAICVKSRSTKTEITFRRTAGDVPAMSFYANLIGQGDMFFETTQTLMCDCVHFQCNGTMRISFDDEMSGPINVFTNGSTILRALHSMDTLLSSGLIATPLDSYSDGPLCSNYQVENFTIVFRGALGNAPRIGLWPSVEYGQTIEYYRTNATYAPLTLITHDGRDDHVKLCNGIGKCDFDTGVCTCPYGWKFDRDMGPCGAVDVDTSDWGGLSRCPGLISPSMVSVVGRTKTTLDAKPNYNTRFIVSMDPIPLNHTPTSITYVEDLYSTIRAYTWRPNTVNGPRIDLSSETIIVNLTSSSSAGPVVLDAAREQVIFVDANPSYPFIGKASLLQEDINNYTRWYTYDASASSSPYKAIVGLAFDGRPWRRILYWSTPGGLHASDGEIYYGYIDHVQPTIGTLSSAIGSSSTLYSPFGIAIHYDTDRLYWVDRVESASSKYGVIRSCSLAALGSDCWADYVLTRTEGVSLSANFTDIVIDFAHNSTLYIVDNAYDDVRVVAIGLAIPTRFNNKTEAQDADVFAQNYYYHSPRMVLNATEVPMTDVQTMAIDSDNNMVLLVDDSYERVVFGLTEPDPENTFPKGIAFNGINKNNQKPRKIKGMILDKGLGPYRLTDTVPCYGRGVCTGVAGAFVCECNDGFMGDCQAATCPLGKAWFQEPYIANVAHDIDVECSNAGLCNRETGACECFEGFEGHACQRRSCPASSIVPTTGGGSVSCFNRGRCMTMRTLALYHRDSSLDADPVEYGSEAGDPHTWDADVLQGCKSDEYGYYYAEYNVSSPRDVDVLHYDCPMGFNSRLLGASYVNQSSMNATQQHFFEKQQITCRGASGYFRLSFRGVRSPRLHANMTAAALQTALESMPSLGAVSVSMTGATLCLPHRQTSYTTITFLSQLGKVAMLKLDENSLGGRKIHLDIDRVQASDPGEVYECSGHGTCDFRTGLCKCYPNYGSSDGDGNAGTRGDCGYNYIV
eukprot:gene9717-6954_t